MSAHEPLVDDDTGFVAGNFSDKYHATNPIARALMRGFLTAVTELADRVSPADVHEVGCGEGHLTVTLARDGRRLRGSDVSPAVVDRARRNAAAAGVEATFAARSLYDLDPGTDGAELVVCCEVLEHVDAPERAVDHLARLARPWLLTSVPREPIWRALNLARGRYVTALGNTPGHVQHWSRRGFLRLLRARFDVVEVRTPLPWTVALCRNRT